MKHGSSTVEDVIPVVIRPDALVSGNVGTLIGVLESMGAQLLSMRLLILPKHIAAAMYIRQNGQPFYSLLIKVLTELPSIVLLVKGPRLLPRLAASKRDIRLRYGRGFLNSAIHVPESYEEARAHRELLAECIQECRAHTVADATQLLLQAEQAGSSEIPW